MTCDLKMSLAVEAEKKLRPLADLVTKLTKQLAHLRHRLETERGNVEKRETDLESLKAASSSCASAASCSSALALAMIVCNFVL